ncbi:MAG: amidohydrolase family protein [Candidatus Tectomicrobia bacterium]
MSKKHKGWSHPGFCLCCQESAFAASIRQLQERLQTRRDVLRTAGLAVGSLGCATWAAPATAAQPADFVFLHGRVYTVNAKQPWAEAVAVQGQQVVFVGSSAAAAAFIGKNTKVAHLGGKMVLPGLVDAHAHPVTAALFLSGLVLEANMSADATVAAIAAYARAHPDVSLVFGYGIAPALSGPDGLTKEALDAVIADRPVFVVSDNVRAAWLNSMALNQARVLGRGSETRPGSANYQIGQNGQPTGWVFGSAYVSAARDLQPINMGRAVKAAEQLFQAFPEWGVTAMYDAGIAPGFERPGFALLESLWERGMLPFRWSGSHLVMRQWQRRQTSVARLHRRSADRRARPRAKDLRWESLYASRFLRVRYGSEQLRLGTMKIMLDGVMEDRTAALDQDYPDSPGSKGQVHLSGGFLSDMVVVAARSGFDLHIHAVGAAAVHEALNAASYVRRAGLPETRITIAHAQLARDEDLPRFAELDVIVNTTGLWHQRTSHYLPTLGADSQTKQWHFKALADHGVRMTLGSDFPAAAGGLIAANPWPHMEVAHTRRAPGDPVTTLQASGTAGLDLETVIRAATMNGAYQLRMEDKIGSIAAGKYADLIVLEDDLFRIEPQKVHGTRVLFTMLGGQVMHDRVFGWSADRHVIDVHQKDYEAIHMHLCRGLQSQ